MINNCAFIALLALNSLLAYPGSAIASRPLCQRDYGLPLLNAVADRNIDEVRALLSAGADPNAVTSSASERGLALRLTIAGLSTRCTRLQPSPILFEMLRSAGADINATFQAGTSEEVHGVMHVAASIGDATMVKLILASGVEADTRTNWGRTALLIASQGFESRRMSTGSDYGGVIALLLGAGADPNVETSGKGYSEGMTPLHFVVRSPESDNRTVKRLIKHGARYKKIEGAGVLDQVSRFYRVQGGNVEELIDLLVAIGGDVNEGPRDRTPLNKALTSIHPPIEVFEAFLKKGANPNQGALYFLGERRDYDLVHRGDDTTFVPLRRRALLELLFKYGARGELLPDRYKRPLEFVKQRNPAYARELAEVTMKYAELSR